MLTFIIKQFVALVLIAPVFLVFNSNLALDTIGLWWLGIIIVNPGTRKFFISLYEENKKMMAL